MADELQTDALADTRAAFASLQGDPSDAAPVAPETIQPPTTETGEPIVAETEQQRADRARDEQGRFAKETKQRETLKLPSKPQEKTAALAVAPIATPPNGTTAPAAPIPEKIAAPQEWGGLAKVKWDRLPVDVQKEIALHEQARMQATADLQPVSELLTVNKEFLVNQAGSVSEAMRQMMQFARMSVDNPVQLAEHILRSKGIDPRVAFSGQPQAPQSATPADLQSYVAQLVQQAIQPITAQAEQQQTQQLQTTIDQFGADPKHPFYNDVRYDMGVIIDGAVKRGQTITLEQAYEQATWANPTIRAHLLNEQREATDKANAAQVQRARAATRTSVTGSPLAGAQAPAGGSQGTALDDARAAYAELTGG